jgi:hypothetical protein
VVLPFSIIRKKRQQIQGRKLRGRSRKNSDLCLMKIDENLREIIESEAIPDERYNDTILRLLREKKDRIEKLDRLNQELLRKIEELSAMAKGRDDE